MSPLLLLQEECQLLIRRGERSSSIPSFYVVHIFIVSCFFITIFAYNNFTFLHRRLIAITGDHPKQVGLRARQDIIKRFSLPVMGAKLVLEYERIRKKLLGDSATNVVNDEL